MASFDSNLPAHEGAGRFLEQYARARGAARFCRRMLWLLVTLGGAWLLIASLDWQVSLAQNWRLAAAILLYSAVIGWNLRFMLPRRFRRHSWREAALRVEEQAPALQGRLLAACELPCEAELSRRDSLAFREALHGEVSEKLASIRPKSLVSWRDSCRPAVVLLLLLLLWAGFSAVVSPAWAGRLWTRAAMTWKNLPRIPGLTVAVESPRPLQPGQPVGIFAQEPVRLIARANLPGVLRVTVETRPADNTTATAKSWRMRATPGQATAFSTSLVMPWVPLEVRVIADDAASAWLRLEPAWPVKMSRLTYATAEHPLEQINTAGAISLAKPGEITLEVHTSQPVQGHLELTQNQQKTVVPLEKHADRSVQARFSVMASGSYILRLEDARTGLRTDIPAQPIELQKEENTVKTPEAAPDPNQQKMSEDEEFLPEEPYGRRVRAYLSDKRP